jgi:hypothetical protein
MSSSHYWDWMNDEFLSAFANKECDSDWWYEQSIPLKAELVPKEQDDSCWLSSYDIKIPTLDGNARILRLYKIDAVNSGSVSAEELSKPNQRIVE